MELRKPDHLEGVDFARRVTMGIRNNRYNAEVPTVTRPLRRKSNVQLTCPKAEDVVRSVDGGEAHCKIEFDWLDGVFT